MQAERNLYSMIKLNNISKSYYGKGINTKVLKDISIEIKKGEFLSIMGRSGCGKTTLLHILGCMDSYDEGKYYFGGEDISQYTNKQLSQFRNKNMGFIFQSVFLINELSALENVELPLGIGGVSKKSRKERASYLLEQVGLEEKMQNRPNQLSGGQQQRVAIARALANEPRFILADEPTGNLDEENGQQIMELLHKLNEQQGVTIVMVTHDQSIAEDTTRMLIMKDGRIVKSNV